MGSVRVTAGCITRVFKWKLRIKQTEHLGDDRRLLNGYGHSNYAYSLQDYGLPLYLEASGGWLLERSVSDSTARDARGCYPLFSCSAWDKLAVDMNALSVQQRLASVVLVCSPFVALDPAELEVIFPDACRPFKDHYLVSLADSPERFMSRHHRRNVRWAGRRVEVERVDNPMEHLDTWTGLYDNLIRRHDIRGIATFGRECFRRQFSVPGLVVHRAVHAGRTVGMVLWYRDGEFAFYHLAAYDEIGYRTRASFALFREALEQFRRAGIRCVDLGAGAGVHNDSRDGLNRFKRGWANTTRPVYLCGKVLNRGLYEELSTDYRSGYFPAYRNGNRGE